MAAFFPINVLLAALAAHICFHGGKRAVMIGLCIVGLVGILSVFLMDWEGVPFWPRLGVALATAGPFFAASLVASWVVMDVHTPSLRNLKICLVVLGLVLTPISAMLSFAASCEAGYACK